MAIAELEPESLLAGKIRLIKRIGRGGMGDVWLARNEATQAELAVKTLHRSERSRLNDDRFRREARLCGTISHRNVVRVFDLVDEVDGTLGLVMELLRGCTIDELLEERGPLSTLQGVAVASVILSAMDHVHQRGIVHRDVKPANVFIAVEPDGLVLPKILDFGIAKLPAAGSALTVDGNVLGTPHYMSPEHIRGQPVDARSDMFSFAVVLYEMLTGVRVFYRDTAAASLAAVLEEDVDPDPRIDPRLWLPLSRALAKRPYERFATCAELAEALRSAIECTDEDLSRALQELKPRRLPQPSVTTATELNSVSEPLAMIRQPKRRRTLALSAVAAVLILGTAVTISALRSPGRAAQAAAPPDPPRPSATATVPTADRAAVPPPPVTPVETATAAVPAPVISTAPPPPRAPTTVKRPSTPSSPPPPKPRTSPKGVATTPGF